MIFTVAVPKKTHDFRQSVDQLFSYNSGLEENRGGDDWTSKPLGLTWGFNPFSLQIAVTFLTELFYLVCKYKNLLCSDIYPLSYKYQDPPGTR